MKKIHADWEIRNLGVDAMEFHVENGDTLEQLKLAESSLMDFHGYVTFVVPAGDCHDYTAFLEDAGYHFDQAIIEGIYNYKDNAERLKKYKKLIDNYSVCQITNEENMERVCSEIRKGIFSNERYSSVPGFNDEKCNRRLAWWLRDWFLSKKIVLFEVIDINGCPVGFFSYSLKDERHAEPHLLGVYTDRKEDNDGILVLLVATQYYSELGILSSDTRFSSNNLPILRINQKVGTTLKKIYYYFSKMK